MPRINIPATVKAARQLQIEHAHQMVRIIALENALLAAHDCLNANFALTTTIEGRRAMAAVNAIRAVLSIP